MAQFEVKGGFDIEVLTLKSGAVIIDETKLVTLANKHPSLKKKGCYVFSRKSGRGSTPIYVGKSERQTIVKEAFNDRNLKQVMNWINNQSHRLLQIWTITQPGRGKPHTRAIDEIETVLVHWAKLENPELINKQKTKSPNWSIKGVERTGRGKRPKEAAAFRRMIGLD